MILNKYNTRHRLGGLIAILGCWLSGCTTGSTLNPQSPAAEQIAELWWVNFGLGALIWVGVVILLLGALFRRRGRDDEDTRNLDDVPSSREILSVNRWIVGGGIVLPIIVLVGLVTFTVGTLRAIAHTAPSDTLMIEVIGHQWWWEVRYSEQAVVTANEIHVPAGQPIEVKLTSVDVIHSFWVPELHGKFDLIPGKTFSFVLQANQPGEYRGQCAEFCGRQHAKMGLIVVAESLEAFNIWLASQAQTAVQPTDNLALQGQEVFLSSRCVECHTIRGTGAAGIDGPDLTHMASRNTLAAATLTNTPEHLADWIGDPQSIKPGSFMPTTPIHSQDLVALVAYLDSLK